MLNQRNFLEPSTWKTAKNTCDALIWKDVLVSQSHCCAWFLCCWTSGLPDWLWVQLLIMSATDAIISWMSSHSAGSPSTPSATALSKKDLASQSNRWLFLQHVCWCQNWVSQLLLQFTAAAATSIYCCYINYVHFLLRSAGPKGFLYGNLLRWCETRKIHHSSPPTICSNQQFWHFWQTALLLGAAIGHKREHELSQLKRREKRAKFQAKLESELKKKDAIVQDAVGYGANFKLAWWKPKRDLRKWGEDWRKQNQIWAQQRRSCLYARVKWVVLHQRTAIWRVSWKRRRRRDWHKVQSKTQLMVNGECCF